MILKFNKSPYFNKSKVSGIGSLYVKDKLWVKAVSLLYSGTSAMILLFPLKIIKS